MKITNFFLLLLNIILILFAVFWLSSHSIEHVYYEAEYKDFISILLTALAVILTALGIFIGIMAIFGYNEIRKASIAAAVARATEVAKPVAAREAQAAVAVFTGAPKTDPKTEDELTRALSMGGNDGSAHNSDAAC